VRGGLVGTDAREPGGAGADGMGEAGAEGAWFEDPFTSDGD